MSEIVKVPRTAIFWLRDGNAMVQRVALIADMGNKGRAIWPMDLWLSGSRFAFWKEGRSGSMMYREADE